LWDLIDQHGNRNVVVDLRDMTVAAGADLELSWTPHTAPGMEGDTSR